MSVHTVRCAKQCICEPSLKLHAGIIWYIYRYESFSLDRQRDAEYVNTEIGNTGGWKTQAYGKGEYKPQRQKSQMYHALCYTCVYTVVQQCHPFSVVFNAFAASLIKSADDNTDILMKTQKVYSCHCQWDRWSLVAPVSAGRSTLIY